MNTTKLLQEAKELLALPEAAEVREQAINLIDQAMLCVEYDELEVARTKLREAGNLIKQHVPLDSHSRAWCAAGLVADAAGELSGALRTARK